MRFASRDDSGGGLGLVALLVFKAGNAAGANFLKNQELAPAAVFLVG
jgi:hypothetical protein